jgi:hypothetical protein
MLYGVLVVGETREILNVLIGQVSNRVPTEWEAEVLTTVLRLLILLSKVRFGL